MVDMVCKILSYTQFDVPLWFLGGNFLYIPLKFHNPSCDPTMDSVNEQSFYTTWGLFSLKNLNLWSPFFDPTLNPLNQYSWILYPCGSWEDFKKTFLYIARCKT